MTRPDPTVKKRDVTPTSRFRRWRDRRAAYRMIFRLHDERWNPGLAASPVKSDAELIIEGWLWSVAGNENVANVLFDARTTPDDASA